MKAITIMQPYATLIMFGAKRFETRPAPPNGDMRPDGVRGLPGLAINAGERIAIHAAAKAVKSGPHPCGWNVYPKKSWSDRQILTGRGRKTQVMEFGVLLGTVEVVRALPISNGEPEPEYEPLNAHHIDIAWGLELCTHTHTFGTQSGEYFNDYRRSDISDQIPYGDWADGRWAWELANIERFDRPIPVKGKRGVWEVDL